MQAFDVQVSGAGIVGKSLALSLAGLGLSVALRSARASVPPVDDVRAYALSPASIDLLQRLKVWDALAAQTAAGYPIGSGVAEGACRHLVKDRLEQTGMRWTVEGAQAMLQVRALYLNDQWEDYLGFRVEQEQAQLYKRDAA